MAKTKKKRILQQAVSATEAAERLGISTAWVYVLLDKGELVEVGTRTGKTRLVEIASIEAYQRQQVAKVSDVP